MTNLLQNGNFEGGWTRATHDGIAYGEIYTPAHWVTWWAKGSGFRRPECKLIPRAEPFLDPLRVYEGDQAWLAFTFYGRQHAGLYQIVEGLEPDAVYEICVHAHAWSTHDGLGDDPHCSAGVGCGPAYLTPDQVPPLNDDPENDAIGNFSFNVGVGVHESPDPFDEGLITWGDVAHIYNGYFQVPCLRFVAPQSGRVVVYLKAFSLWAFRNSDAYWDAVSLERVDVQPPPPPSDRHAKLGPHVIRGAGGVNEWLGAGVTVAKFCDGALGLADGLPDEILAIGNHGVGYDAQSQYAAGESPRDAAARFIADQLVAIRINPRITHWEGHNEPVWSTSEQMAWYAAFEVARMEFMRDLDKHCAIGNFAAGTPPLELWPEFLPACELALEYQAILGLHEYSTPWMWWMTGNYQVDPNEDQGDEGWTTLRYRKVYRQHLDPAGIGRLPLVITECGLDPMVRPLPPGCPGGAWKDLCAFWSEHDLEPDCADYYFHQLAWYDQELQKDGYVIGATVFTCGNYGGPWERFDVAGTPVIEKLAEYACENPGLPFEYPSDPSTQRGKPRCDYPRTYNVIPADATEEQAVAIFLEGWRCARETAGGSYDDAMIGDLSQRWANLYGIPEAERQSYLEFRDRYYPGVEVTFSPMPGDPAPPDPPAPPIILGLHDGPGGEWMVQNNIPGVCLAHGLVQRTPVQLDFRALESAGVRVIYRLNYGYADGMGTVPPPDLAAEWIEAVAATINQAQGVWGFVISNEVNNPSEWPGGYPHPVYVVSPGYYVGLYEAILERVSVDVQIAPAALDPYNVVAQEFGQPGDPRNWAQVIYCAGRRADFIALHTKTQGSDPDECFSDARFSDPPLTGRFLHLRTIEDQLSWIHTSLRDRQVYVTECNTQRKRDGSPGWEADNAEWIHAATNYFSLWNAGDGQPVTGVCFYRFETADPWGLVDKPDLLAVIEEAMRG